MRRLTVLLLALGAALGPTGAWAAWSSTATGPATIGATRMTNASGFTAACTNNKNNSSVTLRWTISPDLYVEGYEIARTGAGGGTNATFRVARTTASLTDNPPTGEGISYRYAIRAGSTRITWATAPLVALGTPTYTSKTCATL